MIEKKIEVCIGTDRAKHVRARLSLLLVEDGRVISEQYHSMDIYPGADLSALRATNEAHLATPGGGIPGAPWPSIPDEQWAEIEQHCAIVHKPSVIAAYEKAQANILASIDSAV
jgi:hypothetical protein